MTSDYLSIDFPCLSMTNFIMFGIPYTKFSRTDGSMFCYAKFRFFISN